MPVPRFIGYTGATVAFLAMVSHFAQGSRPASGVDGALPVLFLVVNVAAWGVAQLVGGRGAFARGLVLLGDALAPLNVLSILQLFLPQAGNGAVRLAVGLAGLIFLGLSGLRLRSGVADGVYPYFLALCGGLLAGLTRPLLGLPPVVVIGSVLVLALLLRLAASAVPPEAHRHCALAAAVLLAAGAVLGLAFFGEPTVGLLAALGLIAVVLVVWAVQAWEAGPESRVLGAAAYAAVTVFLTETLAFRGASLPVFVGATMAWIAVLTVLGRVVHQPRLEPFRESAHWVAAVLACALAAFTAPGWWHEAALPSLDFGSRWGAVPARLGGAATLVAGLALAGIAFHRRRNPAIAATLPGFIGNQALTTGASLLAPLLVVVAATALGQRAVPTLVALLPLALGAALLGMPASVERAYGGTSLQLAGYAAVLLALLRSPGAGRRALAILAGAAALFLWRSVRRRERVPHYAFLAALAAIPWRLAGDERQGAAAALAAFLALFSERLLLALEPAGTRSLLSIGGAVLCGAWAVLASVPRGRPFVLALGPLFLAAPVVAATAPRRGRDYDRVVLIRDWLETAVHLVAFGAGTALVLLIWRGFGLPLRDSGPLIAAWALVHVGLFRVLGSRLPGRPATHAAAGASVALSVLSLCLPFVSASREGSVATLLLNAALAFTWSFPPNPCTRVLTVLGHLLSLCAAFVALLTGAGLVAETLLVGSFLYLWRSFREGGLGPHLVFLSASSLAALVAVVRNVLPETVPVVAILAVLLLAVAAGLRPYDARVTRARLTLAWALAAGAVAVVAASLGGPASALPLVLLWLGGLATAGDWEPKGDEGSPRPAEPEDLWLALAAYGLGHAAGAAWLVHLLLSFGLLAGWAPMVLIAWAILHRIVAAGLAPHSLGARTMRAAAHGFVLVALLLAAALFREGDPPVLACIAAGLLYAMFARGGVPRWASLVSAAAFVLAYTLYGLSSGIALREYYLTGVAGLFYVVMRLRAVQDRAGARGHWLLAGPGGWMREARASALPLLIVTITAVYPFWALLRSREEVHLFFLGGAATLLPCAFWRAGRGPTYAAPLCALLLAGSLYLFATDALGRAGSLFLLAVGPLVLLNLVALERSPSRAMAATLGGRPAS